MIARSIGRSVARNITTVGTAAGGYDSDAQAYITAVEAEDGESLETGVKDAINAFVVGCKADGIWDAIKAACIMAGARTLDGALVPLVGTAPTPYNFVSGDYSRTTGLIGDGSTKYLDSNRAGNADPQNSNHLYAKMTQTTIPSVNAAKQIIASATALSWLGYNTSAAGTGQTLFYRSRQSSSTTASFDRTDFTSIGVSRASSAEIVRLLNGSTATTSVASAVPGADPFYIFANNDSSSAITHTELRLSFYSIGESLDLALLDSRVSTLMTAIGAAIP